MGKLKLLDCTLGAGGEPIRWRYGAGAIRSFRSLLQKTGVDMIELGMLRSHKLGIDSTVYDTTRLPLTFERAPGQEYALLLAEYWPPLADIPARGPDTVDMVRVTVDEKRTEEELEYCAALREKGYRTAVLIEETARYTDGELTALLGRVNTAHPAVLYICDDSGVLKQDELKDLLGACDRVLDGDIGIGFHGRDDLWITMELAEAFCGWSTERDLYADASVAGMGIGALHLRTEELAAWMNEELGRAYELPVFDVLEQMIRPYVETKQTAPARLMYYEAAKARCAYRYTEYYSQLGLKMEDQIEVFQRIERKDALRYDKHAANRALMAYRKEKLDLVYIVPTANRAITVNQMLQDSAKDLLCCGVDIVIYDSSDDEQTRAFTEAFQMEGYDNVHYERYTGGFDGISIDEKVITAFRDHLDHDYIWVMRDRDVPTISKFYDDLLTVAEQGAEWIAVDWSYRNGGRYCVKTYDSCLAFFEENSSRLVMLGASIFRSDMIARVIEKYPLSPDNDTFWLPTVQFHEIAEVPAKTALIIADCYVYNPRCTGVSFWTRKLMKVWAEAWYERIKGLPAVYDPAKASALRVQMFDFHPFNTRSMLALRADGVFDLAVYRRYRDVLREMSTTPEWKFRLTAVMPKWMARSLLRVEGHVEAHPQRWYCRMAKRIIDLYKRSGR